MTLKSSLYLLPKFSKVPLTIVLIPLISTIVNGTLLNFGKRYEDNLTPNTPLIYTLFTYLKLNMDDFSILTGLLRYQDSTQEVELKSLHVQTMSFLLLNFYL
jgi:hypothetical protein